MSAGFDVFAAFFVECCRRGEEEEVTELVLLSYLESVKHSMAFGLHGTRQEIVVAVSQNFAASLVCDKESNTCMGRGGVKRTIAVEGVQIR
ncbi:hypothetical protein BHE74_00005955 [Ensete ventricosum]|nr:hypothetical protein GW17_00020282 [Ensete ventricosum]RWW85359.1 hypothetical protein BHE74_00005955 [Ensete ventricosum]RZR92092.1 hypothetical protein BHM03_00020347 [Ensete ventricosum]